MNPRSRDPKLDLPPEVSEVAAAILHSLADDLQALLWHGSWARGEATVASDHDLIVVTKRLDADLLLRLRDAFRGRGRWSTFVQTPDELRQYPLHGRLQFHYGCVPLFGSIEPPAWSRDTLVEDLRTLARDIRHEARYRLIHKQPDYADIDPQVADFARARNANMLGYATKWALLAMKSRELLAGRPYPVTRAELRVRLREPAEIELVDILERWPTAVAEVRRDLAPLALKLDAFARSLVATLPEPEAAQ